VGFAAETGEAATRAREKRERKGVDLVVANDVSREGAGFEVETNEVTIVGRTGDRALPLQSKAQVAAAILDEVEALIRNRASQSVRA
jgi:phosphopantothenoylcysteine decarboxylase/phosphopantothenate--cysteine ligase